MSRSRAVYAKLESNAERDKERASHCPNQAPLDLTILRLNRPLSRQFLGDQLQLLDNVRRLVKSGFVHEDRRHTGVAVEEVVKVFHQLQSLHCSRARRVHALKLISEVNNLACNQVDPFVETFVGGSCCLVPLRIELVKLFSRRKW